MYSIIEIMLMQALCFYIVYNSSGMINYFKPQLDFFNGFFCKNINELIKFYKFVSENNPILLNYYDDNVESLNNKEETNILSNSELFPEKNRLVKFEDKYLEKYKTFPNEFRFTDLEFKQENEEYEKIKLDYDKTRLDKINAIQEQLCKISEIQQKGNISHENNNFTENINSFGIDSLINFFNIKADFDDDPDDYDIEELYQGLLKDKEDLLKELKEIEKDVMTEAELRLKARDAIINNKLDKFINNYVLEHTPLGNIYMRYNNNKKSFEYFSNSTMPYRYLEPVGRKYVMTYWCKPIFVDIEEELKRAEVKFDLNKEDERRRQEEIKNNPMARLKSYNKDIKNQTIMKQPMKNRSSNNTLPPQIKVNFPNVNQNSEKQLLKERANRYTCEDRLTGFSPLKKIDKNVLDKKLMLSYADFKRMQREDKNKKYV